MPFSPEVKTLMFIRCNRLCCLCKKQCGTNIEAAHIIDEAAGGSNDAENGIPLCFDCHQEIGGYNDRHPKGNKFRPEELRARRDQVYRIVADGKFPHIESDTFLNPIHRIIELLLEYHRAFDLLHHAQSRELMLEAMDQWRKCHAPVWGTQSVRDNTIRELADPAKEWLSKKKSPYVNMTDFDLIEQCTHVLSGFAVSPLPMAMPEVYSKDPKYHTEEELWGRWQEQGEQLLAMGGLVTRLQELTARAGASWSPPTPSTQP